MRKSIPNIKIALLATVALCILVSNCGIQLRPLSSTLGKETTVKAEPKNDKVVFRFFDEEFVAGGYPYNYPEASKVFIPEQSGHESEVAVEFDLEPGEYSGGAVCLWNLLYDARPFLATGALEFWIKGSKGGEIAQVSLADDEKSDGFKTVVRVPLNNYGGITNEWKHISIPLADFGKRGVYWDEKKRVEVPYKFDWDQLAEFRLECRKGDNTNFKVWVDDIFVCKDVFQKHEEKEQEYWDEKVETIASPSLPDPAIKQVKSLFKNDFAPGGFTYVYGGKTAYKVQKGTSKDYPGILACYEDNDDYSGVTIALGKGNSFNAEALRKAKAAGLAFWAKGGPGTGTVYIGLLDLEGDGKKVQSKLMLGDFGKIDTTWHYFMIPLKRFMDKGKFWDENKKAEGTADVDWKLINELRFSVNKGENKNVDPGQPVRLYVNDISFIESIPGYVDPDEFWASFNSKEPDLVLHDFETPADQTWEAATGPKSEAKFELVKATNKNGGQKCMEITYKLNDWCDVINEYVKNKVPMKKRDWTKYWGLKFDFYTDKAYQPINVQVADAGGEIFIATAGGERGWSEVLVPFKAFYKFPYWQPPEAIQNGKFDRDSIIKIDVKPSGEGSTGKFSIDNITLTNDREVKKTMAPAEIEVSVKGALDKVITPSINDGIFGINAALWDGDMLKPATAEYVKALNHKVLRYPGGLRADEDHWKEVLAKKDFMVDIDEFLDFCKQTSCEPMITVNFGTGTPQEAAEWVKHVNIDKKAKVRYWEIGNELYGDWHPKHCSAEDYGKRAAEFIKAMKQVDPTIRVAVIWVLEGDWNKKVFEFTKDLADGVIVHHYSQHAGEENDPGLLAAPQGVVDILNAVRKQAKDFGASGKKYEVWLTEWNSVDFKPGLQTLSIVNALFVADYLGALAKANIEQASYWDIHNDITEQGGDYGYLSRTGAPDGDNVPRLSYWGFKLASESIRGKLVECSASDQTVSGYLAVHPDGTKYLLIVNKYPSTKASATISIPGFAGEGKIRQLTKETGKSGFETKPITVTNNMKLKLPPYSATVISVK
jgi:hypothetical protein